MRMSQLLQQVLKAQRHAELEQAAHHQNLEKTHEKVVQ